MFKYFGCKYASDGYPSTSGNINKIEGQQGTKVDSLYLSYTYQQNADYSPDVIESNGGLTLFRCQNNRSRVVFHNGNQAYRTICSSLVFGALKDGYGNNKKAEVMKKYLEYLLGLSPVKNDPVITELPREFNLHQNFPNPFNSTTIISYDLPNNTITKVSLTIDNVLGQETKRLVDDEQTGGTHAVVWDGKDAYQQPLPSGIYIYQLRAANYHVTRKLILIR